MSEKPNDKNIKSRYLSGAKKRRLKTLKENKIKNVKFTMKEFVIKNNEPKATFKPEDVHMDDVESMNLQSPENVSDKTDTVVNLQETVNVIENASMNFHSNENLNVKTDFIPLEDMNENLSINLQSTENVCEETKSGSLDKDYSTNDLKACNGIKFIPPDDPALWEKEHFEEIREYFSKDKPKQNIELLHTSTRLIGKIERKLSKNNFFRKKQNNELVSRDWLIYSESRCALFANYIVLVTKPFAIQDIQIGKMLPKD